jgi:hypothetical protein
MFDSPKVIRFFQGLFVVGLCLQYPVLQSGSMFKFALGVAGFLMLIVAYEIRFRRLHGGKLSLQSPVTIENTLLGLGVVLILSKNFG